MFRRPYLQVAYTKKNSTRLCKSFHVHNCVLAQRIHHSSVPSTPTTTFPYWSAVFCSRGIEQTSPLTSIYVMSNMACMMNDVGHFRTRSHGVVDLSPLSIAYQNKARNVEVVVTGHQSVCSLPSMYTPSRPSCLWPVACGYDFNHSVLFTASFSSHMLAPCAAKSLL